MMTNKKLKKQKRNMKYLGFILHKMCWASTEIGLYFHVNCTDSEAKKAKPLLRCRGFNKGLWWLSKIHRLSAVVCLIFIFVIN